MPDRKPGISRPRSLDWTRFSVAHGSQIQKNLKEIGHTDSTSIRYAYIFALVNRCFLPLDILVPMDALRDSVRAIGPRVMASSACSRFFAASGVASAEVCDREFECFAQVQPTLHSV